MKGRQLITVQLGPQSQIAQTVHSNESPRGGANEPNLLILPFPRHHRRALTQIAPRRQSVRCRLGVALEVLLFSASANGSFILTRKFVRQGDKYVATALAQELDMAEDDAEAETTPNMPLGALHDGGKKSPVAGRKSPVAGRKSPASLRRPSITPQATVTSSFVALVNDPKERIAREWMQIKAQDSFIHFLGELSATVGFAALYLWYVYGWNSDYFPFPNTHKNAADVYTPLIFVSISFVLHIVFFTLHVVFVLHRYSCNVIRCGLALLENKRLFWALVLQTFIALKLMDTFLASHNHVYSYLQSL